jgi:nucleoside-diphosphate-sugar epimerase
VRVGITGSEGFIGSALVAALTKARHEVRRLDIRLPPGSPGSGSILDERAAQGFAEGCDGVLHFAAVSRVAHGEQDPERCDRTNIDGTACILRAAAAARSKPWVLFASSREVYGEPRHLPIREDAPLAAINVYGKSKARGEALVLAAREEGLQTAILRFASVYGPGPDHPDRVLPAFARAAARGDDIRITGEGHTFDFTHIEDVTRGVLAVAEILAAGERSLPPIHLASGRGITLEELARLAAEASPRRPRILIDEARSFDVSRFIGDPERARALLGWTATRPIEEGMREAVAQAISAL